MRRAQSPSFSAIFSPRTRIPDFWEAEVEMLGELVGGGLQARRAVWGCIVGPVIGGGGTGSGDIKI